MFRFWHVGKGLNGAATLFCGRRAITRKPSNSPAQPASKQKVFGTHGGKSIFQKGGKFVGRTWDLLRWARGKKIDLVVVHNSQEPLVVARILQIKGVTLMDYEHHPGNHLSFRTAQKVIVPESFPDEFLRKFGVSEEKSVGFGASKKMFICRISHPMRNSKANSARLGIFPENILVVVRPHAPEALYHRQFSNEMLDELLDKFSADENVKIILLPRKKYQGAELRRKHPQSNIIIPERVLDGANLLAAADLVISGGGTMNREAAALGVPTATIFAGRTAAIDEYLFSEYRLQKIESAADLEKIKLEKKIG